MAKNPIKGMGVAELAAKRAGNPAGRDAGLFTNLDAPKSARTRYFKHATDSWALDHGFPYRLISGVTADGIGAPVMFLKTRAIVAVDEDASGTPVTESWKISGLQFFDKNPGPKKVRVIGSNPLIRKRETTTNDYALVSGDHWTVRYFMNKTEPKGTADITYPAADEASARRFVDKLEQAGARGVAVIALRKVRSK